MTDDAVSSGEMRWIAPQTDPIDAVLSGVPGNPGDEDLLDVAAIVHDLRSTCLPGQPLRRGPALAAFTQAHLDADGDPTATAGDIPSAVSVAGPVGDASDPDQTGRKRHKMLTTITGFVGTLTGKAVLGTALAAASVGGLHAADVVDIPVLPDDPPATEQPAGSQDRTPTDAGAEGQQTAADKQAAAEAHAQAVQEWTECVADAAAAQGDAETRTTGAFDPRDTCGDMPQPGDFGLTDLPSQASDVGQAAVEGTPGATARPEQPGSNAPTGGGSVPAGADAPAAPLISTPAPTQSDAVTEEPGSGAPAGGGSAPAPDTDHPASPPTTGTPAGG